MTEQARQAETILVTEAARRLGISRALAYRAAARGDLPAIRVGGRVLILRAEFERLLKTAAQSEQ